MILFPLAVIWLIVVFVWVLHHSQNNEPEERVWRRWRPRPRNPRDGDPAGPGGRDRARKRASTTAR
jgi:hypothetical protein